MVSPRNWLRSESVQGAGFLLPTFVFLGIFVLLPVAGTMAISFFRDVLYLPREYIGLQNYRVLFADRAFWNSVRFTVLFTLVSVPLEVLLALIIALVMNEKFPFRGAFRACVLIPWAIPAAVSGRVFELVYNYSYGAANWLLRSLGLTTEPVNWLGTDFGAFAAVVVADMWKTTPFAAIILIAGLSSIPEDLYAQAKVDRAGYARRFFSITLPLLWPVLVVALLFRTIEALRVFDVIYVLTGGGPGGATESVSLFAYRHFSTGDYGYGSAASVMLFLIALALSIFYVRLGGFGGRR